LDIRDHRIVPLVKLSLSVVLLFVCTPTPPTSMGGKAVSRSESRDSMDVDVTYLNSLTHLDKQCNWPPGVLGSRDDVQDRTNGTNQARNQVAMDLVTF
jgi:hypothetical protein